MTVDLLSVRLKEAKRELTNLKTAHLRGLGGLKIFEYPLEVSGHTDYVYTLSVTLTFDSSFTKYPFISCAAQCDPNTFVANADLVSMDYIDDGTGAVYVFDWYAFTSIDPYKIMFYSSVPITDISYIFYRST